MRARNAALPPARFHPDADRATPKSTHHDVNATAIAGDDWQTGEAANAGPQPRSGLRAEVRPFFLLPRRQPSSRG